MRSLSPKPLDDGSNRGHDTKLLLGTILFSISFICISCSESSDPENLIKNHLASKFNEKDFNVSFIKELSHNSFRVRVIMWDGNVISKEVDQLYYIQDKTVTDITEHFKNQVFNSAENEEEILKRVSEKVQNRFNTDKITVKDGIKKIMSVGFDEKIIYATIELLFSVNLEGRITNMVYTERYLFGDLKWTLSANQLLEKVQ